MSVRHLLHFKHLGNFVLWCNKNGIEVAHPTGDYQILKVKIGEKWDGVYIRESAKQHFSISDDLGKLVRKFYNDVTK